MKTLKQQKSVYSLFSFIWVFLASEENELEIASNINDENDEHENDAWIQRRKDSSISELRSESEDIESKDSTDSGVNDDMSDTRQSGRRD